jgi:hypothetical protein
MADAFVWGEGGERASPAASRRRLAEALIKEGSSGAPVQSWTQGLARVTQALMGGYMAREEDQKDEDAGKLLLSHPALQTQGAPSYGGTAPVTEDGVPKSLGFAAPGSGDPAAAISSIESGGKYDELGPFTKTGDRAYGKYQVMGANVPTWTKAHLGQEMTPEQFLQNPQAQDAVFKGQFGQYANKYGPEGAAKAWFAGEGGMNNPNARDQLGTTVASYADKFNTAMGGPSGAPASGSPSGGVAQASPPMPSAIADYARKLIANRRTRALGVQLLSQYTKPHEQWLQQQAPDGTIYQRNSLTGETKVVQAKDKQPTSVSEYEYYRSNAPANAPPMDYAVWATAKARASATNIANNVDLNSGQTYDKLLAEGLGKSHAALSNDVEGAQSRARDLAAMQGAIDSIQKNGGTTGGMGQQQILDLKKTINAGANSIGLQSQFNESDIADKEFLQKFNRQMAGAQAKGAVGARVTNFEMNNYLKANPGLDMSVTGNQRLIGIQSQIEHRNIAIGNAIRDATAQAIAQGRKIDPVSVHKIITEYDDQNQITDPVTGQDLTQSYALPEFQKDQAGTPGVNSSLAVGHETNIGNIIIKRVK